MTTVGVLRGGIGDEHEVSLKTGASVLANFAREPYRPVDIFIDRNGVWHLRGIPVPPERALATVDVAFNALHGEYGEDGTVQRIFERAGVPYTGAGAYASSVSLNKSLTKDILKSHGVKVPMQIILKVSPNLEKEALEAFRKFSPPVVVKPMTSGSSVGVTLSKTFAEFWEGVKEAFAHSKEVLVEEYIMGKEATSGIIENFREQKHYAFLPVEIALSGQFSIFNYEGKYGAKNFVRVPSSFTKDESSEVERIARLAHEVLNLRHYSRTDLIVSPRGVYFLETNALPALTPDSSFAQSLSAVGVSMEELLDHLITLAMNR